MNTSIIPGYPFVLGRQLYQLRQERGLRQETVARALHISRQTYSHYEHGDRRLPPDVIVALADFYQISTDLILRGETLTHRQSTHAPFRSVP